MLDRTGLTLKRRYRLEAHLGHGGMGEVYRAWDVRRRTHVAIKVLRDDLAQDSLLVAAFESEARVMESLAHENIVHFYGFGRESEMAFIVMDYVDGITLRERMRQIAGCPMPLSEVDQVVIDICAALHFAHREGVVHRDVKPSNILLRRDGRALLTDFGIAHAVGASSTVAPQAGTPAYMSPEHLTGDELDGRSDIYSLGVVIYEMLAGGQPFPDRSSGRRDDDREKARRWREHSAPVALNRVNPVVSDALAHVVCQAMSRDRADRPATAQHLRAAWQAALTVRPTCRPRQYINPIELVDASMPAAGNARPRRSQTLRKWLAWASFGLVAVTAIALVVSIGLAPDNSAHLPAWIDVQTSVTGNLPGAVAPSTATVLPVHSTAPPLTQAVRIVPGTHEVHDCFTTALDKGAGLTFCVEEVAAMTDGRLQFDVSWTVQFPLYLDYEAAKPSDTGNRNMHITDNLGNRYDHLATGGAAAQDATLTRAQPTAYGWFVFPPPRPGATVFAFHDDDMGKTVTGIDLTR